MVPTYVYEIEDYIFLHSIQRDPKQSHNHQLDWTDFTQHCPVSNQAGGHTEVCVDQAEDKNSQNVVHKQSKMK